MFGLFPVTRGALTRRGSLYNELDDFFNGLGQRQGDMKLDVREEDKQFIIDAELPGMKKENIGIDFQEDRLIISACNEEAKQEQAENYIHRERSCVSVRRAVYLPGVEDEGISAKYEDGILTVTVPKASPEKKKRQILID